MEHFIITFKRYYIHSPKIEWTSIATICTRDPLKGYPFSNTFSVSDGATVAKSSGIPYFYVPSLEMSVHDLKVRVITMQRNYMIFLQEVIFVI